MAGPIASLKGRRRRLAGWELFVAATVVVAVVTSGAAGLVVARAGVHRPDLLLVAIAATAVVNLIYVVVVRKRDVFEAIDISEAPIVALALLLPPAEALVAFTLGTISGEVFRRRAPVKKAFNAGIRIAGASVALLCASAGHLPDQATAGSVAVLLVGTALYTAITAAGVATVVSLVDGRSVFGAIFDGFGIRAVVWMSAVLLGVSAANLAVSHPAGLLGLAGPLSIVWLTTRARDRAERDSERLQALVGATAAIQASTDERDQELAVMTAARSLFPMREVTVQSRPPTGDEMGSPLWTGPDSRNWLILAPRDGCDPWRDDDTRMLTALTGAAISAVDRARLQRALERDANMDALTGLANRRCFERELEVALAAKRGVAVLLIDLDGFKQVNDQHGHEAGDRLLALVAERLEDCLRQDDLVGRLGGDEFVIMLPGVASSAAAQRVADSVEATFATPVRVGDVLVEVTPSIGMAFAPPDGWSAQDLLRRADQRMYRQKHARRAARRSQLTTAQSD